MAREESAAEESPGGGAEGPLLRHRPVAGRASGALGPSRGCQFALALKRVSLVSGCLGFIYSTNSSCATHGSDGEDTVVDS